MKRNQEGDSSMNMTKRYRPQDMSLRLLVSSRVAGGVIGKGGMNINRLREQNNATISIPDTLGPERVINIGAERDATQKVVEELLPSLEDVPGRETTDSKDGEIRMLVNTTQAGCIIGRSGFKIKELREQTGAQIRVFTEPCPHSSDRVALISGTREKIMDCLRLVMALLEENPPKGMISPYDPANYDESYASEYGGFADGRGRGMHGGGVPRGGGGYGLYRGGGGYGMPPRGGPMGGRGFHGPGMRGGRGGFGGRGGMGGMGGGGQLPPGGMDFNSPMSGGDSLTPLQGGNGDDGGQETQQFSIPKSAAGAIIGKGGARIRKIRGDSGAQISIDDAKDGATERIITIQGSADQVQLAHFLLQKSVRENSGPDGY